MVVDARGHTDTAVYGGILNRAAQARGIVAFVVDGSVRDAAELRESVVLTSQPSKVITDYSRQN